MLTAGREVWQAAVLRRGEPELDSALPEEYISPVLDRILGALLFLPVPAVLWLFTRTPLGGIGSLGLGFLVMVTHRTYARPFALRRAGRRCLWCGGGATEGPVLSVVEPLGKNTWRACSDSHRERLERVLGWGEQRARLLRAGILGTLAIFLPAMLLAGTGRLGPVTREDTVAFFKLGVSLTVIPLGWLAAGRGSPSPGGARAPFPIHIQALIGTCAVLWLFRLIGVVWLAQASWQFATRVPR
jgi:hypothetical protein